MGRKRLSWQAGAATGVAARILLLIRIKNEPMRGSRLELQKGARVCVADGQSCIHTVHAWHQDGLRRPQEGGRPCQPDRLPEEQGLSVARTGPGRAWHCAQWHTVKQGWFGRKQGCQCKV